MIRLMEDLLEWWNENEKRYPLIRNLAARVVVSKMCAALKPAIVNALLFLNKK